MGQYVCFLSRTVHTWIQHFQPCSSRGIQQLYLQAQRDREREKQNKNKKNIWRNTQVKSGLDLGILKVREVLDLSAQSHKAKQ